MCLAPARSRRNALAKKGLSTSEIAKQLGRERNNVGVHLFKIKRPEKGNQLGNAWKKRDRKPVSPEEGTPAR